MSSKNAKSAKPAAKTSAKAKAKAKQVTPIAAAPFGHDLGAAPQVSAVTGTVKAQANEPKPSEKEAPSSTKTKKSETKKTAGSKSAKNDRAALKADLEALVVKAEALADQIRNNFQAKILRPVGDNPNPVAVKFKDIAVGTAFVYEAAPDLAVYLKVGNTSFLRSEPSAYTNGQVLAVKGRTKPGVKVFPLKSTLSVDTIPVADKSLD